MLLVFRNDAHFAEEQQDNDEQVEIVSLQHSDEVFNDSPLLHLLLDLEVFRQIEEYRETDVEEFVLFANDSIESFDFLVQFGTGHLVFVSVELVNAGVITVDLVFEHVHNAVSDLVLQDDGLELLVVGEDEEDAEQVGAQFHALLELFLQHPTQSAH